METSECRSWVRFRTPSHNNDDIFSTLKPLAGFESVGSDYNNSEVKFSMYIMWTLGP